MKRSAVSGKSILEAPLSCDLITHHYGSSGVLSRTVTRWSCHDQNFVLTWTPCRAGLLTEPVPEVSTRLGCLKHSADRVILRPQPQPVLKTKLTQPSPETDNGRSFPKYWSRARSHQQSLLWWQLTECHQAKGRAWEGIILIGIIQCFNCSKCYANSN